MSYPIPLPQGQLAALTWKECLAADGSYARHVPTWYRHVKPVLSFEARRPVRQVAPQNHIRTGGVMVTDRAVDQLLVERFQEGDNIAFNLLVTKYQGKLLRVVSRLIHNPSDAEDIVQESFVRAYRALPAFRHESAFYTWLFQIGMNAAKNFLKKQKLKADVSVQLGIEDDGKLSESQVGVEDRTPLSDLENKQTLAALNKILDTLPDTLATALLLRELEGMSYEEIAQVQCCPIGTVRSRIYRAREVVASKLAPLLEAATATPKEK